MPLSFPVPSSTTAAHVHQRRDGAARGRRPDTVEVRGAVRKARGGFPDAIRERRRPRSSSPTRIEQEAARRVFPAIQRLHAVQAEVAETRRRLPPERAVPVHIALDPRCAGGQNSVHPLDFHGITEDCVSHSCDSWACRL